MSAGLAQTPPLPLPGDFTGTLGPLHLVLRLQKAEQGGLTATLDSPDQGANGLPADHVDLANRHLTVNFPTLHATYAADESPDGTTLTGIWTQGAATPLVLHLRPEFVPAATPSAIDGDWTGALATPAGPLTLLLHLKSDRTGTEYLTFDSPAQHATGLIADNVTFADRQLTFDLPVIHGHYTGILNPTSSTLAGTWTQGAALPLSLTRIIPFTPATKPSAIDGDWTGIVSTPRGDLHTALHVRSDRAGAEFLTLDSPDQLTFGLEATHTAWRSNRFSFEVPRLHGSFSGTLHAGALDGTWTQGTAMPVHLRRPSPPPPPPAAPPPPLPFTDLPARLNTELKPLVENPALAGTNALAVAIGVIDHGERRLLTYGTATPNSIFEIGSITKTFTGLLLAQMAVRKTITLETPLRALLPAGTVTQPLGNEVTLLSLATHHSGLPRLPDNMRRANPDNPYADYTLPDLYTFMSAHGAARPPAAPFLYSNVGAALLGQALAAHAGLPYEALLQRDILAPLHLAHTSLALPEAARTNLLPGHDEDDSPAPAWDLNAIAPAGGLHSDIGDMLAYVEVQLRPPTDFAPAIALQHRVQADTPTGKIALFWFFDPATGDFSHDGATGGFASYVFFNPQRDLAAVVLVNRSSALANSLGRQIAALLEGHPASPLQR